MTKRTDDAKVDQAAEDSFPASDPPATSGITGPRIGGKTRRDNEARPKGTPTDERHATETAYHHEDRS
jgi:hypothetical protein